MDKQQQAKNGFKTFMTTLVVALVVFGGIYYAASSELQINDEPTDTGKATEVSYNVRGTSDENSIFGELNKTAPQVLAGTDVVDTTTTTETAVTTEETQETTVPDTGSETLIGTVITLTAFSIATYFIVNNPRKFALNKFESNITKEL